MAEQVKSMCGENGLNLLVNNAGGLVYHPFVDNVDV